MLRLRSWASSRMIVSYCSRKRSPCVSASRMPSVISLTQVSRETWSPKRTLYPTAWPSGVFSSWASAGHAAGGDAPRRRVPDQARHAAAQVQTDLRELGGLPGARLAGEDEHLVVFDGVGDVVARFSTTGRFSGYVGLGRLASRFARRRRERSDVFPGFHSGALTALVGHALDPAQARAEAVLVDQHCLLDRLPKCAERLPRVVNPRRRRGGNSRVGGHEPGL